MAMTGWIKAKSEQKLLTSNANDYDGGTTATTESIGGEKKEAGSKLSIQNSCIAVAIVAAPPSSNESRKWVNLITSNVMKWRNGSVPVRSITIYTLRMCASFDITFICTYWSNNI